MSNAFEAIKVTDRVWWVGAIDWGLRNFHGYETSRGSTYNAFLVMGEKPTLIDTVKPNFYDEMMSRIRTVIDPSEIKYVVSNHAELDHSGALPRLYRQGFRGSIYCTPATRDLCAAMLEDSAEIQAQVIARRLLG